MRAVTAALLAGLGLAMNACVVVPAYEREHLSHPSMQPTPDALQARSERKLHQSREGASGGDAQAAGGGCGCSN
ncbi:MAG: DUF4266 domain-containing protein [Myxococcales bacterium]|jgi:hypothetical protein|nr:DUF4266 domain-containing protein [Myxococcales bacterium]